MRILIVGAGRRGRMESDVQRAFARAGHETLLLDDRRLARRWSRGFTQAWVHRRAEHFRPDFVLLGKCLGLELETVERLVRDRANAMWYSDPQWHTHLATRDDIRHIGGVARLAHTLWLPEFVDEWRALGYPAGYLPFAGSSDIRPGRSVARHGAQVVFLGTGYDPARAEFLVALTRHVRVRVWGPGWEPWADRLEWSGRSAEGATFEDVCASADVVLGITASNAKGRPFYTDRMFRVMLAGGFYLGEGGPGAERMLADGVHCAWYADLDDCVARLRFYLGNEAERERIRLDGERFVRAHHTWDERVCHFLSGEPYQPPL